MNEDYMSQRTTDLMLLLFGDGVDGDELRALVDSAFSDGLKVASALGDSSLADD
ncbi:MAG: hypothetical protein PVF65_11545 [Sphingomonadales bacterium]|jgi:hypothetical protein